MKLIRDQVIVKGLTLLDFVARFHLSAHAKSRARAGVSAIVLMLAWAPGCRRVPDEIAIQDSSPSAEGMAAILAMVPPDAGIVVAIDMERLRGKPAWSTVLGALAKNAKPFLDGLAAATGFDLKQQLGHVLIALPAERRSDDRFVLIADADRLDQARVTAWLHARFGGKTAAFLRGHHQIVISQGAWVGPLAALASANRLTTSAADNPELRRLCTRASGDHGLWFAAIVPTSVRRTLMREPRFSDVGSIARVSGFVDLDGGAHVELVVELSNSTDAVLLTHRLAVYLNQAKRHPEMLVLGLAPYLEAMRLASEDSRVRLSLDLSGAQLGDCIERIEALAHATWTK